MWVNENQSRKDIVEAGRRLYEKRLLVSTDGNLSVRISDNEILITSSGFCKGTLTTDQITKVDMEGNVITGMKPARDIRMHLATYRCRPEAKAIVHAHPPITTGFAMTREKLDRLTLPEVLFTMGKIGITDFALATTEEVPLVVEKTLKLDPDYGALILASHGALTFGKDIMEAFYKMETLEMFLTATLVSKLLGNVNYLSDRQEKDIWKVVRQGTSTNNISCTGCGKCMQSNGVCHESEPQKPILNGKEVIKNAAAKDGADSNMRDIVSSVVEEVMKKLNK